jgi:hypothetical protein
MLDIAKAIDALTAAVETLAHSPSLSRPAHDAFWPTMGLLLVNLILAGAAVCSAVLAGRAARQSAALAEKLVAALDKQTEASHEQRKAQIRPMVIYTYEGRPALVNAGNGIALNVRARWQRPDTQEPTPHKHVHAMGVGHRQWFDDLQDPFRAPEAVQVVYQDVEGTWYYSRFSLGEKYKPPKAWKPGPWTEGIWETGPGDGPGLVYDETGKVQCI